MQSATVVIVDDVAETRSSIRRLLELSEGFAVVGEAANGQEAIGCVQQLHPDCVLLDINMPVLDGIHAAETISLQCPETAIVMMSVQGEKEYLRKAMAAGARDYLVKPFGPDDLAQAVRQAVELTQRRRAEAEVELATRLLLVVGPKGGVGRTTMAVNVALGLVSNGDKVCLLDLNTQFSDLAMALDIVPAQTLGSLAQYSAVGRDIVEAALEEHASGLQVLVGPARPEEAEAVTPDLVQHVLTAVRGLFHWVVVDAPVAMGETMLSVFDCQPECLLVVTPELAAVRNAGQLLQLLRQLEYDTHRVHVVLNRWDATAPVSPEVIQRNLQLPVAVRIPDDPEAMRLAATRGVPVVQSNAKCHAAKAIQALVDELSGKVEAAPKRRVFGLARREARWAVS